MAVVAGTVGRLLLLPFVQRCNNVRMFGGVLAYSVYCELCFRLDEPGFSICEPKGW